MPDTLRWPTVNEHKTKDERKQLAVRMNINRTPLFILSLILLLLINAGGLWLIMRTAESAQRTDPDALREPEALSASLSAFWVTQPQNMSTDGLLSMARAMMRLERLHAVLFLNTNGQPIAHAGRKIPEHFVNSARASDILTLRDKTSLLHSRPVLTQDYADQPLISAATPIGYILLELEIDPQAPSLAILNAYSSTLVATLLILNSAYLWAVLSYRRKRKAFLSAPPEIQQQFARGYRQLKDSIEMQQQAIDRARDEALKTSELKSQFIANMSHEIRTPLNAIIGFTDLLLKSPVDHRQRDFLQTIKKSSLGLLQIINDILDFSRIEAGKVALDLISIDLRETLEDVLTVMAPTAHEKELELISVIPRDIPHQIEADPLRLKQILTNLVSNAVKFSERGSIVVRLHLEEKMGDLATFKVSVTDNGIGIAKDKQAKLFQAFSQADTSTTRQFGGSGLGLVIAKQLTEQMQGKIGVVSQPNQGSNFWFTFQALLSPTQEADDEYTLLQGRRIAIFERHPLIRMGLTQMLDEWQVDSLACSRIDQLQECVAAAKNTQPFDAAIISMTFKASEIERLKTLLEDFRDQYDCPVLLLNYTVDTQALMADLADFASATLVKPLRFRELYHALSELLQAHPTQRPALVAEEHTQIQFNRPPHILVVDDNPANLKLVSSLLGDLKAVVTEAASGPQALQSLANQTFDMIYMDIQMPGMDGVEVTRQIRRTPSSYRDIPIVALTAHALASEKAALLKSGMDDYLSKPVTEQQLIETILEWTDIERITAPATTIPAIKASVPQPFEIAPLEITETELPIIDQEEALQLAGGKHDLATELFEMLIKNLGQEMQAIREAQTHNDKKQLLAMVHHLHGATRYCGVPALRAAAQQAEQALKGVSVTPVEAALDQLFHEIDQLLGWSSENTSQKTVGNAS